MSDTLEQPDPDGAAPAARESDAGAGPTRVVQRARNTTPPPPDVAVPAPAAPVKQPGRPRRRALWRTLRSLAAAIAAVSAGALAATIWRSTVSARATAAGDVVHLEPASRGQASMTRLTVATSPLNAQVSIDGVTVSLGAPYEAPRDGAYHRVHVDAPGHVAQTFMVRFDRELVPLEVTLERQPDLTAQPPKAAGQGAPATRPDAKPQAAKSGSWVRDVGLDSPDPWKK